jgi:hypothetical protein
LCGSDSKGKLLQNARTLIQYLKPQLEAVCGRKRGTAERESAAEILSESKDLNTDFPSRFYGEVAEWLKAAVC